MENNWTKFWREKNEFDTSMDVNFNYFISRFTRYIKPTKESVILDIGSGPGHLEDAYFDKVKEIHGVDISERYNAAAREKHKDHPNVFFHDLSATDYLNFSMLDGKKFDIIIVMSVLQYYKNKEEVVQLLQKMCSLTRPGSKVLLCDLIVQQSKFNEIIEILLEYLKAGKILVALSLFFRLRFSRYYDVKKNNGFLILTEQDWKHMLAQLNLKGTFIKEKLTLHKRRKNILITID
ncbi:MAG: methyltransferase type 12 [Segetibacter sp.]|jgi:2-polyprenyl-3-methyl-5-hydroxy-6-metoxy-1,4-benzoquinol methylase|nr:methyltransferase type 12 [Segetibacter sp.]